MPREAIVSGPFAGGIRTGPSVLVAAGPTPTGATTPPPGQGEGGGRRPVLPVARITFLAVALLAVLTGVAPAVAVGRLTAVAVVVVVGRRAVRRRVVAVV